MAPETPTSRRAAALAGDIARHRARFGDAASELRQRLQPDHLAHDVSERVRTAARRQARRFERRAVGVVHDLGTDLRRWLPSRGSEVTAAIGMAFSAWSARRRWTRRRRRRALVGSVQSRRQRTRIGLLGLVAAACGMLAGWRWSMPPPGQPAPDDRSRQER